MSQFADSVLVFGGAGLVGFQVARKIAKDLAPRKIIIASRYKLEAQGATDALKKEFPTVAQFIAVGGDVFLREEFTKVKRASDSERETEKVEVFQNSEWLNQIFKDIFGTLRKDVPDNIRNQSLLVKIIEQEKPDVIVDCINTATAISYQNIRSISQDVKRFKDQLEKLIHIEYFSETLNKAKQGDKESINLLLEQLEKIRDLAKSQPQQGFTNLKYIDILIVSQAIPQLISLVRLLAEAMKTAQTRIYIKIGTTGTGGMGMNIPYTHSEDKPSFDLLSKTSVAFAQTGLLFLLARTPGAPIIKEIKPGAMIGYKKVEARIVKRKGKVLSLFKPRQERIVEKVDLSLREDETTFEKLREKFSIVGLNTGENGFFGLGEFEAITAINQMEMVTAEEVADLVVHEIVGRNTGKDIITALDSAVVDPSYRAGYLRPSAITKLIENEMKLAESKEYLPSVATGELGPPMLTKLLFEVYLIKSVYPTIKEIVAPKEGTITGKQIASQIMLKISENSLKDLIVSLGIPILLPDGQTILRGPFITIPESASQKIQVRRASDIDDWASQGWVDLRGKNFQKWIDRFSKMYYSQQHFFREGSAEHDRTTYIFDEIQIGEVVAWVFNNELGGYRIR